MPNRTQDTRQYDIFGKAISPEDAQGSWNAETPTSGHSEADAIANQTAQQQHQDNDEKRYQYWQSQHDKLKNRMEAENQQLREELNQMKARQEQLSQPQEEEVRFPDPPDEPQKPYGYSLQEAMTDPSSESAKYIDALNHYNAEMNRYNYLKSEWDKRSYQEQLQLVRETRANEIAEIRQQTEARRAFDQAISDLQRTKGWTQDRLNHFLEKMSRNEINTFENFVRMYEIEEGLYIPAGANQVGANPAMQQQQLSNYGQDPFGLAQPARIYGVPLQQEQPTYIPQPQVKDPRDLEQLKRAQSIPTSMGVHAAHSQHVDPMDTFFSGVVNMQNKYSQF